MVAGREDESSSGLSGRLNASYKGIQVTRLGLCLLVDTTRKLPTNTILPTHMVALLISWERLHFLLTTLTVVVELEKDK